MVSRTPFYLRNSNPSYVDGPLGARGQTREFCCGAVAVVCPACLSRQLPLAQMGSAIHSQTEERPCWPPPYTGFVDRRTDRSASFPSSPAPAADKRSGRRRRWPVGLPACHHGPHDAGHFVGPSHGGELARLAAQQVQQPWRGGWPTRPGMLDDRRRAQHQQLPQPLVAGPADAAQALLAGRSSTPAAPARARR